MKTIKIPEPLHQDLMLIKVNYKFKTLGETIRFLQLYWNENSYYSKKEKQHDKSKK